VAIVAGGDFSEDFLGVDLKRLFFHPPPLLPLLGTVGWIK